MGRAGSVFPTAEAAASAALEDINPASIQKNIEHAGRIVKVSGGFTFTAPQTLNRSDDSSPGPRVSGSIGTYHTHAGAFEPTDEIFSPQDKLKATLAKELSFLGTPRRRILKFTPMDLLGPDASSFPQGKVDTIRMPPVPSESATRETLYGRWHVSRPSTSDVWDVIFFRYSTVVWTQDPNRFQILGSGGYTIGDDSVSILWRADLEEEWLLPLRSRRQVCLESTGRRLIASKVESAAGNGIERFT